MFFNPSYTSLFFISLYRVFFFVSDRDLFVCNMNDQFVKFSLYVTYWLPSVPTSQFLLILLLRTCFLKQFLYLWYFSLIYFLDLNFHVLDFAFWVIFKRFFLNVCNFFLRYLNFYPVNFNISDSVFFLLLFSYLRSSGDLVVSVFRCMCIFLRVFLPCLFPVCTSFSFCKVYLFSTPSDVRVLLTISFRKSFFTFVCLFFCDLSLNFGILFYFLILFQFMSLFIFWSQ